ncbi:hypothetical protein [Paenibacillus pedocola]|uniref:hypothetical protein n=1 Tax=Paenibacillus pedocola TaxID=3242193 RepID=UPI002877E7F6|nr:hypothetical protein [Paenibacillus typhae]
MRMVSGVIIIAMAISLLIGCGNKSDDKPKSENATQSEQSVEPGSTPESSVNVTPADDSYTNENYELSRYYVPEQGKTEEINQREVVWKGADVTLIATKTSDSITSLQVKNAGNSYDVNIPEYVLHNISNVVSVALSANHKYLAINVLATNIGHQLVVLDLTNGQSSYMNNNIDKGENYESIYTFNWSPKDNKLALSYGYLGSSSLAVYDFDNKKLIKLPQKEHYIETPFILWDKDNDGIDFISEYPSDQYRLYRYTIGANQVKAITNITKSELSKYDGLIPTRF